MADEVLGIEKVNLAQELSENATSVYCSVQGGDRKTKAMVYNASNNPSHKVADMINKTINVKDVLVEIIQLENEETGVIEEAPRVVLIDDKGEAYQAVSAGMFNAIRKAIQIFGQPTWDEPLPMLIKQISVKNGSMLTAEVKL
ncbi:MAG: hypothetical protein IKE94_01235 [Aeriscardovia sp.]|nr:hypothetical protein [Aeriscardovia sp.]